MENKKIAIYVIIGIFGLGVIWWIWNSFLNYGQLELASNGSFTYTINDITKTCLKAPCTEKLKAKTYEVTLRKINPDTQSAISDPIIKTVKISFGKTTTERITFSINPYMKKIGAYEKPEQKISVERGENDLKVIFDKKTYTLPISRNTPILTYESSSAPYKLVYLAKDVKKQNQALFGYKTFDVQPDVISFFQREMIEAVLFPSFNEKGIYIADNGENQIYFVNLAYPSRTNIARNTLPIIGVQGYEDDSEVLYQAGTGDTLQIWFADNKTRKQVQLEKAKITLKYLLFKDAKTVWMVSKESPIDNENKPVEGTIFISQIHPAEKNYELILQTTELPKFPDAIEKDAQTGNLNLIIDKQIYQLVTEEN